MNELELVNLLNNERRSFTGDGAEIRARQTADSQLRIYLDLLQLAANISWRPSMGTGGGSIARASAKNLRDRLEPIFREKIKVTEELTGVFLISAPFPVIDEGQYRAWKTREVVGNPGTQEEALRSSAFITASVIYEGLERNAIERAAPDSVESDVLAAMYRYSGMKVWRKMLAEDRSPLSSEFAQLAAESESLAKAAGAEREQYKSTVTEINARLQLANESSDKLTIAVAEASERLENMEQSAEKRLEALERSLRAEMELNTMRELWKERAEQARRSLRISLGTVVAMGLAAAFVVWYFGSTILNFVTPFNLRTLLLNTSVAGAVSQQIGRVVLVSVPIVIYFWIMKIVVRILIRSLLLMDDARQRQTIMDSYFLLTKEGKTDDRAMPMMLWALFRQIPGHGPDGIEPPDFTEAINAGLKTGILPR
jgi:hypothetical protein